MPRLLLVSTQMKIQRMAIYDSKQKFISVKLQNSSKNNLPLNKDFILCNHCKRTASNGIRCMGICVADSDY